MYIGVVYKKDSTCYFSPISEKENWKYIFCAAVWLLLSAYNGVCYFCVFYLERKGFSFFSCILCWKNNIHLCIYT